jgi:uncharacterized membrane protein HdeD (DUF308 family)
MAERGTSWMDTAQVNTIELADRWWTLALRGVAAILFGLVSFMLPGLSLLALVTLYGVYAVVDGAFNLVLAVRGRRTGRRWGSLVFQGVASIAAGVLTFVWPGITAFALLFVIAFWALVSGVAQVAAAIRLRKQIRGEWLLALTGMLSIALGVLLIAFPGAGALALVFWIAGYAVVIGGLLLALAFKLRNWARGRREEAPHGGVPTPT